MKLEQLPQEFIRARPLVQKIRQAGFEAYFVGGSVRDALLARDIHDVDIATSAYPAEIKRLFPRTIDVGIEHGTVLVLSGKSEAEHYEVTTFRTESQYTDFRRPDHVDFVRDLTEDLKRRDFTINALAMQADGEVIDLFDGLSDLAAKKLRAVGKAEERFNEDALRIMRAMRFSAALGFEIEAATFEAMTSHAPLLTKISIERIFIELEKLLLAAGWKRGLKALIDSGAWQYLPDFKRPDLADLAADFQFKNSAQAWTWLTLQFGKLDLRRWKVSTELIKAVSELTAAYALKKWDLASLYRFGLETAQLADDLKIGEGRVVDSTLAVTLHQTLQIHDKSEIRVKGADLLAIGYKPGPELGKLLKLIEEKIVSNELKNERSAIFDFVRENSTP